MCPPIYFFTLATEVARGFPQYLKSCTRFDIKPVILGRGQKYTGFSMKLRLLAEVLPGLEPYAFVAVTDGYDVVFQQPLAKLYEFYREYNKTVVFSSELGPGWPNLGIILPETPDPRYRCLNAGFWMAHALTARKMVTEAYSGGFKDDVVDQGMFQQWFSTHPDEATVDWKNTLVTTSWCADGDLDCRGPLVRNKHTNTYPCVLHMPRIDMGLIYRVLKL